MKEPILSREEVLKIVEPFADEAMMLNHQDEIMRCIAALESAILEKLCGEPAAWLVEEGRTFRDKVFIGEWQANNSIAERNDGARKTALYAINRSKA